MSPSATRADRLAAALDEFVRSAPDVEAAAVVSFDGLPMASALPEDLDEDRLGAMSAALLSLGEQAAMGLGRGMLNQIFVEGEHGFVFLMSARDQAVLTAIADRTAKIGFMLFEMRRAADRIGRALESAEVAPAGDAPAGVVPGDGDDVLRAAAADVLREVTSDPGSAGAAAPEGDADRAVTAVPDDVTATGADVTVPDDDVTALDDDAAAPVHHLDIPRATGTWADRG